MPIVYKCSIQCSPPQPTVRDSHRERRTAANKAGNWRGKKSYFVMAVMMESKNKNAHTSVKPSRFL